MLTLLLPPRNICGPCFPNVHENLCVLKSATKLRAIPHRIAKRPAQALSILVMKREVSPVWPQPPAIGRRYHHVLKLPTCYQERSKEKIDAVSRAPWMAKRSENSVHDSWNTQRSLVLEGEHVVQTRRVRPSNLGKQRLVVEAATRHGNCAPGV